MLRDRCINTECDASGHKTYVTATVVAPPVAHGAAARGDSSGAAKQHAFTAVSLTPTPPMFCYPPALKDEAAALPRQPVTTAVPASVASPLLLSDLSPLSKPSHQLAVAFTTLDEREREVPVLRRIHDVDDLHSPQWTCNTAAPSPMTALAPTASKMHAVASPSPKQKHSSSSDTRRGILFNGSSVRTSSLPQPPASCERGSCSSRSSSSSSGGSSSSGSPTPSVREELAMISSPSLSSSTATSERTSSRATTHMSTIEHASARASSAAASTEWSLSTSCADDSTQASDVCRHSAHLPGAAAVCSPSASSFSGAEHDATGSLTAVAHSPCEHCALRVQLLQQRHKYQVCQLLCAMKRLELKAQEAEAVAAVVLATLPSSSASDARPSKTAASAAARCACVPSTAGVMREEASEALIKEKNHMADTPSTTHAGWASGAQRLSSQRSPIEHPTQRQQSETLRDEEGVALRSTLAWNTVNSHEARTAGSVSASSRASTDRSTSSSVSRLHLLEERVSALDVRLSRLSSNAAPVQSFLPS